MRHKLLTLKELRSFRGKYLLKGEEDCKDIAIQSGDSLVFRDESERNRGRGKGSKVYQKVLGRFSHRQHTVAMLVVPTILAMIRQNKGSFLLAGFSSLAFRTMLVTRMQTVAKINRRMKEPERPAENKAFRE